MGREGVLKGVGVVREGGLGDMGGHRLAGKTCRCGRGGVGGLVRGGGRGCGKIRMDVLVNE